MNATQTTDTRGCHFDYNHLRPITEKDLQQFNAAERSYMQTHHYGIELHTNKLV
ncbi:hypothetical protein HC026_05550 [Lactobacillus sp. LC28-10]|uniref:Acetyltransferase n=1 Tax=Secundilactobacillus angelensis TaxID=2722706 RepID=A0ABX1KWR5_9LACO|nr:hypothetical protein [Secundilactobacillus angelensis]MCH5462130.1 hypothetical protein [Secundilactobacillus angelensis]NLR18389.1 hypothetical protein [Secundilactobacillus angelensis]